MSAFVDELWGQTMSPYTGIYMSMAIYHISNMRPNFHLAEEE